MMRRLLGLVLIVLFVVLAVLNGRYTYGDGGAVDSGGGGHLDARFVQPLGEHDAAGWAEYFAADLAGLPAGEVPLVVFFGDGTWEHPDPTEQGEQPHVRGDGTVGYTYRFEAETLAALGAVQVSGRRGLVYVNPWRWLRVYERREAEGDASLSLFAFCLELRDAGWDGVYFDGFPPVGKVGGEADDARCAAWLRELRRVWPGVFVYLHGSGRAAPGSAEAECDVVMFGEWGEGWVDPGAVKPLVYARRLLLMGVEPVYKPASKNPEGVRPSRTQWFKTFAAVGGVVVRPGQKLQIEDAVKVREQGEGK